MVISADRTERQRGPLFGVRVLDMGTWAVGPTACSLLGFLGADVIRIDNPSGEAFMDLQPTMGGMGTSYINANMQKRIIALDLREADGRALAEQLVARADVLVENRLPGVMEKLGFGWEDASSINPVLVYVSVPGYGRTGPYANRPATDPNAQALSGLASIQGEPGGPAEISRIYAHLDATVASLVAQGALLGLLKRRRGGEGSHIDVPFMAGSMFLQATRIAEFAATGTNPPRQGSASSTVAPSASFPCLDGRYVNITAPDNATWASLCEALEMKELAEDVRFVSNAARLQNRVELQGIIEAKTKEAPQWWWLQHLRGLSIPCGPLNTWLDIARDAHFVGQEMMVKAETAWGTIARGGHPWRFHRTPCGPITGTHKPGADGDEVRALLAGETKGDQWQS
ncbi:MAG: hypothetical protein GEU28_07965 [Dehalococcoidia bacterium]|nr:hypothetical protein [Dehalococcoidia bacterium]